MKPPPPGAVPEPEVRVITVPAVTVPEYVAEQLLPAPEFVVQERSNEPTVQVVELVDGVTVYKFQVGEVPDQEWIVMLGVQAVGAMTDAVPPNAVACAELFGLFQAANPVCPATL